MSVRSSSCAWHPFETLVAVSIPGPGICSRMLRTSAASIVFLSIAGGLFSADAQTGPQLPDYEFFCGEWDSQVQTTILGARAPAVDSTFYPEFWDRMYGTELNEPMPSCPTASLSLWQGFADESLRLHLTVAGIMDPRPRRTGPIVLGTNGKPVIRAYAHPTWNGVGGTSSATNQSGVIGDWTMGAIQMGVPRVAAEPEWYQFRLVAHETAHVVQMAHPLFVVGPNNDGALPGWINDGTAEALASRALERHAPGSTRPLSERGSLLLFGLRPWDRSLTWNSSVDGGLSKLHRHPSITTYTSSSLWTYLADRYFGGQYSFLPRWWSEDEGLPGRDNWLGWLERKVKEGKIGAPLYRVFTDFIANYATWGENRFSHVGEDNWLRESFDCQRVDLGDPRDPATNLVELSVDIEAMAAACIEVTVADRDAGNAFSVDIAVITDERSELDDLHATASRLGGQVGGGGAFDCYDAVRTVAGPGAVAPMCAEWVFEPPKGGELLNPHDWGAVRTGAWWQINDLGDFVKDFRGVTQLSDGALMKNIYFVVNVPVDPDDEKHAYRYRGGTLLGKPDPIEVRLQFRLVTGGATVELSTNRTIHYDVPLNRLRAFVQGTMPASSCMVRIQLAEEDGPMVELAGVLPQPPRPGRYAIRYDATGDQTNGDFQLGVWGDGEDIRRLTWTGTLELSFVGPTQTVGRFEATGSRAGTRVEGTFMIPTIGGRPQDAHPCRPPGPAWLGGPAGVGVG